MPRVRDDIERLGSRGTDLGRLRVRRRRGALVGDPVRRLLLPHGRPGDDPVHRQREPQRRAAPARGWPITSTSSRTSTSGRSSPTVAGSPVRPASTPTASCRAPPATGPTQAYGFGDELRVSLVVDGIYWGAAAFLRHAGRPWFTEAEVHDAGRAGPRDRGRPAARRSCAAGGFGARRSARSTTDRGSSSSTRTASRTRSRVRRSAGSAS